MSSTSPRPKRRSEPVVPDKVLAKPVDEITPDFDCIPNDIKQNKRLEDAKFKEFLDDTGVEIVIEVKHANTIPRAKTETQMNKLTEDIIDFSRSASDRSSDVISLTRDTSDRSSDVISITSTTSEKPRTKVRRRISINPSWKAVSETLTVKCFTLMDISSQFRVLR